MIDDARESDVAEPDDESYRGPSKSSRKREMLALQSLGEQLVALSADRLSRVPMPDDLRDAIRDAQRFTKHEARRRQLQYVGRLMRNVDADPIKACLDAFNGVSRAETARQHRLERLRSDLLDDEKVLGNIARDWPGADLQHLRVLRRNALKEREQGKPPRAYRELFRVLRDLDAGAGEVAGEISDLESGE
ncbi:MAG TPA: ribosome biogenesis factor YjgA [Rhodocyclaceae bacterium]|nr:ribosome biogenesis factor YjgA [Rhodocyclaceae bacterium]HRQ46846.1 ribosome biogenesis factor YjgA [Rhodocyclaceae bacterium]